MNEPDPEVGAIRCRECWRPTQEGKPYCSRHVLHMPYVARLREALSARARFAARPRRWISSADVFRPRFRTVGT